MVVCLPYVEERCPVLAGAAQAALRKRAVQAVLDGRSQFEAARVFGVHPNAVNRWVKGYWEGGWPVLAERRQGRRAGEQAALSPGQEKEVIALVRDATPDQLGLAGFLWTREAVAELILERYGVRLARTTVGRYCASGGSVRRNRSGGPWSKVRPRCAAGSPRSIPPSWRRPGGRVGMVLWLDELGVRSNAAAGRSWAPVGRTPMVKRAGKRFRVNMISAISAGGLLGSGCLWGRSRGRCSSTSCGGCWVIVAGGRCT
jgi:transposase